MKQLLNTLYVTTPESYLALDGENVLIMQGEETLRRVPLHNLESIVTFGYTGASPALMGACAKRGVTLSFMTAQGRFLARVIGEEHGNVLLRKAQYRVSENECESCRVARNMLAAKLHNSRWVLERAARDYPLRLDVNRFKEISQELAKNASALLDITSLDSARGIEGESASRYFSVFDDMILQNKDCFRFTGRNRRPPLDNVNAMLSYMYTILTHDLTAALYAAGLDPYVGFMHSDRSGRCSLALDLLEELRSSVVDRFVLSLINTRQVSVGGFYQKENGAVIMTDDTRKAILMAWQKHKQEALTHPFLKEKISWGLVPHTQAMLLARHLRGDLEEYPPFLWK
ncbi:CRISPR-associated endonuclease Cas1 [Clostridia bacterium]|nr:CRISPR-associated endonuclease Cas1 [Clostridia bacterium]